MTYKDYITRFKTTPVWATMIGTVEASPWHREANVAVHTQMCMDHYEKHFAPHRTDEQNKLAMLELLFHDTGKPAAEEVVERKDGSGDVYRRYAGHEQDSAVTFTEIWLTDSDLRRLLSPSEARQIRWMIENHLPYGLKDQKKREALRTSCARVMNAYEQTFFDCLRSDAAGRISDNHDEKLQKVEDWIHDFQKVDFAPAPKLDPHGGTTYMLIGPSGSGKSTWVEANLKASTRVVSMDNYRLAFYHKMLAASTGEDPVVVTHEVAKRTYSNAFLFCCENESAFKKYMATQVQDAFRYAKISKADVFVDNTNGSKKARARWVQEARNIGQRVVAVEFWNTFETLMARQRTRAGKEVPYLSVKQQYYSQVCAALGTEADSVIIVPGA